MADKVCSQSHDKINHCESIYSMNILSFDESRIIQSMEERKSDKYRKNMHDQAGSPSHNTTHHQQSAYQIQ